MAEIEYFYGANSAFAYLGMARLMEIAQNTGRRITHRPVRLGDVVGAALPQGFGGRSPEHYAYYFGREIERWAEHRGVAVKGGIPANHGNDSTLANAMLVVAASKGQKPDQLALAFMQAHWRDHADLGDEATLRALATGQGLDAGALVAAANGDVALATLAANTSEAIKRSVFGSPSYFIDGDMFYGQDRLELVERAISRPFARVWS
ncbi:MAG: 2-hydroxychromene-2-carboxylate isomerase [Rhodobacteraceae bacterium]|nr:2-hydroxychromene-2-carboxylate isomerase [Paracoccaceae bacterium]